MAIEWNDEKMATGFSEIDTQHKEWIRRLNEFDDAVVNHKGQEAIQNTLDFLTQYSETHFAGEEAIMEQLNSPVLETNRAEHNKFRGKLSEIRAWVKSEGATSVEVVALKDALEEWLVNHICTVDVQLRKVAPNS
jgi:hemerythrin-like metal-binding protein